MEHTARVTKDGIKVALALKRLKDLRPKMAWQLFQSTVIPVIDYGSNVWAVNLSAKMLFMLNQPQRIGMQAIIGAFHIVALLVAEAESSIDNLELCIRKKCLQFWINLHTLPKNHPFWDLRYKRLKGR